jgi:hypothetical protein
MVNCGLGAVVLMFEEKRWWIDDVLENEKRRRGDLLTFIEVLC